MNAPHWHLAINHLPVVGVFLVMLLLGYALVRGRGELYGVSLGALVLLALATVPVFFTGRSADEALMEFPDVDDKLVHLHEAAANLAFIGVGILGVVALAALWFGRKAPQISRGMAAIVFALSLLETALMGRAANLGGNIRHPEIRATVPVTEKSGEKKE
jgi:hypothetical protein